jgi:hypothetical protein
MVTCIVWAVYSCSPATTAGKTATLAESPWTATFPPSKTTTQTQTPSRTPTQTLSGTSALTPTQTPTATLFPGLQPAGPFFILSEFFTTDASLTFIDFSGSTHWTIDLPQWQNDYYEFGDKRISPDWKWYAYITGSIDESGTYPEGGVVLHLLNLLTGERKDIASLVPQDFITRLKRSVSQNDPVFCESNLNECISRSIRTLKDSYYSMDWSPDGKSLAFGAMLDGDSADIYLYDIDTEKIRRLEKRPGNPQSFYWSPDGQWMIYEENDIPARNREDGGWLASRWAVRRNGTEEKKIPGDFKFLTWFSDYEFIYRHQYYNQYWDPTVVNIQAGYEMVCYKGYIYEGTVDPRSRLMVAIDETGENLFLGPVYSHLELIASYPYMGTKFHWIYPRGGTNHPFIGWDGERWLGITPGGEFDVLEFDAFALISPNYWLATYSENVIRVYDHSDKLRYELNNFPDLYDMEWDTNSQGLFLLSNVKPGGEIFYWKLGDMTPRIIAKAIHDEITGWKFTIAPIFNLRTLPHLRILPTRAAKPAEGNAIWSRTTFQQLFQPGTNYYDVTIPADSSWRWSFSLGTTDTELFEKILAPEDVEFRINGQLIDANMFRMTDQAAEGRFSRAWAAMLSGWRSGDKAELEIKYTLRTAVRDGNVEYPAGEYHQIISVVVE